MTTKPPTNPSTRKITKTSTRKSSVSSKARWDLPKRTIERIALHDGTPASGDSNRPDEYYRQGGTAKAIERDWWRLSGEVEVMTDDAIDTDDLSVSFIGPDPTGNEEFAILTAVPVTRVSHFNLTLLRPDPLIVARVKGGRHLRKSDWWEFVFEGDAKPVRRERAIMILSSEAFRDETDQLRWELRHWITLHYIARTSSVVTRCSRGDAPKSKSGTFRRLDNLDLERASAILFRDLHLRNVEFVDVAFVRETLASYLKFLVTLNDLPDESLSRQVVNFALRPPLK